MPSRTTNYNLYKPDLGQTDPEWGTGLNQNFDTIDSELKKAEDHRDLTPSSTTKPHNIAEVDETSTDTAKNKVVSNSLAKGWEDHRNTTSGNPHGVDFIELDDTPASYTGEAGKAVIVKSTEDGVEFNHPTPATHGNEVHNPDFLAVDGSNSPTADIDWGGHKVTNVSDPTEAQDAATKNYVDTQDAGKANTDLSNVLDTTVLDKVKNVDGSGSGLDADLLDGQHASAFASATHGNEAHDPDMLPLNTSSNIDAYISGNEWLEVKTTGIMNFPCQSACHAYATTDQSISGGTWVKVNFDAVAFDRQNEFSLSNNRFTATEGGLYLVSTYQCWKNSTPEGPLYSRVTKNGSQAARLISFYRSTTTGWPATGGTVLVNLDAGDYIEVEVYANNGGTLAGGIEDALVYIQVIKVA